MENIEEEVQNAKFSCDVALDAHEGSELERLPVAALEAVQQQVSKAFMELKQIIEKKYFTFYYLSKIHNDDNKAATLAKDAAKEIIETSADVNLVENARSCIENGRFLWFADVPPRVMVIRWSRFWTKMKAERCKAKS